MRAAFGLAFAMATTSPALIAEGYYRVHLWVIMGGASLASLIAWQNPDLPFWPPVATAVFSYIGGVVWLYDQATIGRFLLVVVGGLSLTGALLATPWVSQDDSLAIALQSADVFTSGLLLGTALASMLLGHYYLNEPGMKIEPLQDLVILLLAVCVARLGVCGIGLALAWNSSGDEVTRHAAFLALRWLAGIVGVFVTGWMTWETLKIPNTQSATGLLYVSVIVAFIGELVSLLMGAGSHWPV